MITKGKVLIIRFSSIGDIVLTTPVVRCLKTQFPELEVHFLVKKSFIPVVENNPYIDKIHSYSGSFHQTLRELKEEHFDYVIDLHNNIRSNRFKFWLQLPSSTVHKINWQKWLMVVFKINILPKKHIVERYFETVQHFGVVNDNKGLDFFIATDDEAYPEQLSREFRDGYLVFVVGAAHYTKQIPTEKAVEILNKANKPVLLLGGVSDSEKANEIAQHLTVSALNLAGKTTLSQTAALIKSARVVITPDTGSMHIASAFNKPIISVWGNTIPDFGMYPYMPDNQHLSYIAEVNLSCRPCTKIGYTKCPKGHFKCMLQQDTTAIVKKIEEFWKLN